MEQENEKRLKVLLKRVDELPILTQIKDTLEEKQKLVGGLIEVIPYQDALIICNEEGKILNLKPNIIFDYDYIAGDCIVVGDDYENAGFKSLTDEQIERLRADLIRRSYKSKDKNSNAFKSYNSKEQENEL